MKRKSLLFVLLMALFAPLAMHAQTTVTIGDGTSASYYTPIGTYYNYSITEQLYTADEIGMAGTINSVSFYWAYNDAKNYDITVYMANVDATDLSTGISLAGTEQVYSGNISLSTTAGWVTIPLDSPFAYDGTSNLLIGVNKTNGSSWFSGSTWQYTSVTSMARYSQNDSNAYTTSTTPGSTTSYRPNIQLNITAGSAPSCPRPKNLTVSNIEAFGASFSWIAGGDETDWVLEYSTSSDFSNATTVERSGIPAIAINDFTPETTYYVHVKAICGGGDESSWSSTVNFTTLVACPVPTAVTISNITTTTADVSWTSDANRFNIMLGENVIENVTNPYTLTELTPATAYTVKVKAICGGENGESQWTSGTSFTTAEVCPDGKVCIGTGTSTNQYLPTYTFYNYSLTQQIYTAAEIGEAGAILSVDFYKSGTYGSARNLDIYMVSTEKSTFSGSSDWIAVTASDLVYSGSVTFADNDWTTIELDNPFIYDGRTNVALIVDDNTGSYVSAPSFYAFSATSQAIRVYNDNNPYDPTNPSSYTGTVLNQKNRVRLAIGEPPACNKPTGLAVNYTGGTTAEVTWNGDAETYNIDVNGEVTEGVTSPYTLEGLELATTYEVMVQADCGNNGTSEWTSTVNFTTDACMPENMCEITYEFTDSYGDGWNGASINVVDVVTGAVIDTWTISSGSTATGSLAVCDGRAIQFVWVSGNYDDECSYVVYDLSEDVIFSGSGAMSSPVNYTMNCSSGCAKPKNLEATDITINSATLSWTGSNDSYVLQYRPWFQVGEDTQATGEFVTYTYDLSEYSGMGSIAIRHYDVTDMFYLNVDDVLLTDANGNTIFSEDFEDGAIPSTWTNYDVDGDGYVWDLASSTNMTVNGNYGVYSASWLSGVGALTPDNWLIISNVEMGGTFSFAAVGQDPSYPAENFAVYISLESDITEVAVAGTSYDAENLEPGTPYAWQVKGVCGEDESNWTTALFKTLDNVLVFATDGNWNEVANWTDGEGNAATALPTTDNKVRIDADAIIPAGYIAEAGKATINGGSITIKDGAELKHNAATLWVTMEKEIEGYGEGNEDAADHYYFISTPFSGATIIGNSNPSWSHVLNLTDGDYDLYAFDATQELEWINYKSEPEHSEFTAGNNAGLVFKKGYLYANAGDNTLEFNGTIAKTIENSMTDTYEYNETSTDDWNGWKLLGNPFACSSYINYIDADGNALEADFYTMNTAGDGYDLSSSNVALAPLTGALINFSNAGTIQFATEAPAAGKRSGMLNMNVTRSNKTVSQARLRFGQGHNLGSMSFRNGSKLYMPVNGNDYAVVYTENQGEMPVSFKAAENGTYTFSVNTEDVEFGYLHLIDNMNGNDVDLLSTPSYSFEASTTDYASRFRLVFATGNAGDDFAFFCNGSLVINNEGNATLQVIDVTGRMISSESINGCANVNVNAAPGVYMLRLVNGDNVKVQKVVVR